MHPSAWGTHSFTHCCLISPYSPHHLPLHTCICPVCTPGLSPDEAQLRDESWGGVLQEVTFSGTTDAADFMKQAVDYANNKCWGTLAARYALDNVAARGHCTRHM